jgi:hypothetical protein
MPDPTVVQACSQLRPHWVEIVSRPSTPIVATVAATIAGLIGYRQWRTAQNKLKLDLFERRLAVHTAAMRFLSHIMTEANVGDRELHCRATWKTGPLTT